MKTAIIGGSGKMGRWFACFLLKEGNQVIITGRNQKKLLEAKQQLKVEIATNVEAVKHADVVLLSVPIENFEQVIEQISPYTRPEQVIIDITSLKILPVEIMHKYIKKGRVLGTHPVFGPGASEISNQNFVLTPISEEETILANKIKQYLEKRGAKATLMTPQEHDEMMTVILSLSHFIAIVAADTLLGLNKFQRIKNISGTTYKVLLTMIESVISEDPELYASLQMNLPNVSKIEESFQKNSRIWAELVKNKDRQEFVKRMHALRNRMEKADPDFGRAYENMYRLTEEPREKNFM